jgi:CRISPR-associated endoribonuclease Cas6
MIRQKQERLLRQITLSGKTFRVTEMIQDAAQHPWAGQTHYESLLARYWESPPPGQFTFQFASPTVFRSNQLYTPLPLPRLVFESLHRRWNHFSLQTIPDDFLAFARDSLVIRDFQIRTRHVRIKKGGAWRQIPGFVGRCTFGAVIQDQYWLKWGHLLAAFALYAGVGKNTSMGFGQTRLLTE